MNHGQTQYDADTRDRGNAWVQESGVRLSGPSMSSMGKSSGHSKTFSSGWRGVRLCEWLIEGFAAPSFDDLFAVMPPLLCQESDIELWGEPAWPVLPKFSRPRNKKL